MHIRFQNNLYFHEYFYGLKLFYVILLIDFHDKEYKHTLLTTFGNVFVY